MSAYLPSAQYRRQRPAGGYVIYDGDGAESDYDYVCNVSDDDIMERDIDAEIEARERATHREAAPSAAPTMSQRMLSSLQKAKLKNSRAGLTSSYLSASATRLVEEKVAEPGLTRAHSNPVGDVFDSALSRKLSSCTDRLEARISKSFLSRQESVDTDPDEPHDMSALYSGRRTYPAESIKKSDPRLSDGGREPVSAESKMMALLAKERSTRGLDTFREDPVAERDVQSSKSNGSNSGVSFHFYGGSSASPPLSSSRGPALALTNGSTLPNEDAPRVSRAVVMPDRSAPVAPVITHATLATQLGEIESLVDGIETCMSVASFSSLAARIVGELELLRDSTQKIRSTGTTMILEEVARQQGQTETAFALRRLVTRAVAVQKHIAELTIAVRQSAA